MLRGGKRIVWPLQEGSRHAGEALDVGGRLAEVLPDRWRNSGLPSKVVDGRQHHCSFLLQRYSSAASTDVLPVNCAISFAINFWSFLLSSLGSTLSFAFHAGRSPDTNIACDLCALKSR